MHLFKTSILNAYTILIVFVWSLTVMFALYLNINTIKSNTIEQAKYSAKVSIEKDITYRLWAAKHGGIYVWSDESTPPNPNLAKIPLRDIKVDNNKSLTLMNPAYMIRQVMEWQSSDLIIKTKITSLKPIRIGNSPDEWEKIALLKFEKDRSDIYEVIEDGATKMRAMHAFVVEKPCMKCHEEQGYKLGDIRGGISTTIDMTKIKISEKEALTKLIGTITIIWLIGIIGCLLAYRHIGRYLLHESKLKQDLLDSKTDLENTNKELSVLMQAESLKRLENEKLMIQQSKMAMMGEMIGAIAHQWRQPLNSLGLSIQDLVLAKHFDELDENYMERFRSDSMELIKSMSKTIDDFRNFFIPSADTELFYAEFAIQETLYILGGLFHSNKIKINFIPNGEHHLQGYKNELKQVLINILINAKDAMLSSKTPSPVINISIVDGHSSFTIEISDNGGGVDESVFDRIFEPYFTTKEQGKGTGIGLYMSREIVERHMHGKIKCENIDNGVKFLIELPSINNMSASQSS